MGTDFMRLKNIFYKQQKKTFNSNIEAKKNLIKLSKEILDIENWKNCIQKMKDFQTGVGLIKARTLGSVVECSN